MKPSDDTLEFNMLRADSDSRPEDAPAPAADPAEAARARLAAMKDDYLSFDHPIIGQQRPPENPLPPSTPAAVSKPEPDLADPRPQLHGSEAAAGASRKVPRRRLPSKIKPIISAISSFLVLFLIFKSPVIISEISYLIEPKPAQPAVQAEVPAAAQTVGAEPVIEIPKLDVRAPIVFEPSIREADIQTALQRGVVHYGTSSLPGEPGNSVLVGHSSNDWWEPGDYKFVFVLLDKLIVGDRFSINYNSTRYVYEVTEIKVVEPTDLSVLAPTSQPTMTLITCTPPGTSWKRLIIKSKQISPAPQLVHEAPKSLDAGSALPGNAPSFSSQIKRFWNQLRSSVSG